MMIYALLFTNIVFVCLTYTKIMSHETKKLYTALLIAINIVLININIFGSLKIEIQKLNTNLEISKKSISDELADIKSKMGNVNDCN